MSSTFFDFEAAKIDQYKSKKSALQIKVNTLDGKITAANAKITAAGLAKPKVTRWESFKSKISSAITRVQKFSVKSAWKGVKSRMVKLSNAYKSAFTAARRQRTVSNQASAGLVAMAGGGLVAYNDPNATAESAAVAGVNSVVESPLGVGEGLNGVHSTAGALCSGDLGQVLKNVAHLAGGILHGLVDLIDGLGKAICDGLTAATKNAQGVGVALRETACFISGAISWAAEGLHDAIDWTVDAVDWTADNVVSPATDFLGDTLGALWLVDPSDASGGYGLAEEDIEERRQEFAELRKSGALYDFSPLTNINLWMYDDLQGNVRFFVKEEEGDMLSPLVYIKEFKDQSGVDQSVEKEFFKRSYFNRNMSGQPIVTQYDLNEGRHPNIIVNILDNLVLHPDLQ